MVIDIRKIIILILFILLFTTCSQAEVLIQRIVIEPLSGVTFSTVTLGSGQQGWITASTIALRGRKEINIYNTSSADTVYLSTISASSVTTRTLYPREDISFVLTSDYNLFVTANTTANAIRIEITEMR